MGTKRHPARLVIGATESSGRVGQRIGMSAAARLKSQAGASHVHLAGVENALHSLGQGLLAHPKNIALRDSLRAGRLSLPAFHAELLRIIYRLIFLCIAEDRTVDGVPLLHPRDASASGMKARSRYLDQSSVTRLRTLASTSQGGARGDLWLRFNVLVGALSGHTRFETARRRLALPVLGGFLWSVSGNASLIAPNMAEHGGCELTNADFLETIRNLTFTRCDETPVPVDFKNIRSEELGGAYERLLALTPQISADGTKFTFEEFSESERKTSGSYYTPDALVQSLLDAALEPAVADAVKGKTGADRESAILNLRVCDPSCGSGNFLVGAARRLAHHLAHARARTQARREPSQPACLHAIREVIPRCLYGVDLNPMAVELCKISLWIESMEPGKPLNFLDAHIKCGNSLLGTSPRLMQRGIPDEAFDPLTGDDKRVAAYYRRRNRQEKDDFARALRADVNHSADKPYEHTKLLADAWCAAFVWKKHDTDTPAAVPGFPGNWDAITERVCREIERSPHALRPWIKDEINRLAAEHRFFHWHLEFPEVFVDLDPPRPAPRSHDYESENPSGGSGTNGFDCVVGNPPFLNQLESSTSIARGLSAIVAKRSHDVIRGYTDASAMFLLIATQIVRRGGRVALVQPQSLLSSKDAAPVRTAVLKEGSLEAMWISNEHVFEGVSVFTCAPTIRMGGPRRSTLARSTGAAFSRLPPMLLDNDALAQEETWAHLAAAARGIPEIALRPSATIATLADATADFRDQYYGLRGFLRESATIRPDEREDACAYPPIVTAGLLDLAECRWGNASTRILKTRWQAPCVDRRMMEDQGTLGPWIRARLVPKILLATQTRVIEVFVDAAARFIPSTPLITITAKQPGHLWRVAAALASPVCTALAMQKYAGAAMSADAIKLSAKQVLSLPLPRNDEAWRDGAAALAAAHDAPSAAARRSHLGRYGGLMCRAYEIAPAASHEIFQWWTARLGDHRDAASHAEN